MSKKYIYIKKNTYKLLRTWKVKQLYHSKVIACDDVKARVGHTGTGDVCFVSVTGPDPHDLVPKDTRHRQRKKDTFTLHLWLCCSSMMYICINILTLTLSRWPR